MSFRSTKSRTTVHLPRVGLLALASAVALVTACSSSTETGSVSNDGGEAPASAFPDDPARGSTIKIGLINPEGGPTVSIPEGRITAQAAADYANAHLGGIAGHKIEVVNCANKEDPASARDCANQMVEAKVSAVVIPNTGQSESIIPIVTGAGIPYVSQTATSALELTAPDAFSLTGGSASRFSAMAAYSKESGFSEVTAFVSESGSLVETVKTTGGQAFEEQGIGLNVVPIPMGAPDSTPQVSSGLAGDVDAVVIVAEATTCTSVLSAMTSIGATQPKMMVTGCVTPATIEAVGDALNSSQVFSTSDYTSDDPEAALYRSVVKRYAPDADMDGLAFTGYQAMLGLIRLSQGLQGDPTGPNVATAIKAAKNIPLPVGHGITLNCNGTADPEFPTICTMQGLASTYEDGKFIDYQLVD